MPSHKLRSDSLSERAYTPRDPCQNRRGTPRFLPQLEMRPSSIAQIPVESPEAPHNSIVFLISHRHHEKLPKVTITSRGNPGFPTATRERPRDSSFNSFEDRFPYRDLRAMPLSPSQLEWRLELPGVQQWRDLLLQQIPSLLRDCSHTQFTQAQHPGPQALDLDCPLLLGLALSSSLRLL